METLITLTAKKKMIQARNGEKSLPAIAGIAVGDGAVSGDGKVLEPSETDIQLRHELLRREYVRCEKVSDTCYRYRMELGEDELAGEVINEAALYDAEGDLLAIRTFPSLPKDESMEMAFEFDDKF